MIVAILGRQPEISIAELSAVFGADSVKQIANDIATIDKGSIDISQLGGITKYGEVVAELSASNKDSASLQTASKYILDTYYKKWHQNDHKTTLGISAYGLKVSSPDIQKVGLQLKRLLKKADTSLRLVPNQSLALSTAQTLHNKLLSDSRKVEIIIIKTNDRRILIAECRGVQDINAYTKRDHGRPKRDAFVGMLPPKLAQIMINLATSNLPKKAKGHNTNILDPFCGTGVVLQEAALMGYTVYGSDLSEKMIDYSQKNLDWLKDSHRVKFDSRLEIANAIDHSWQQPVHAVVCETYLGQPFSAPPSPAKLKEVTGNCNHIITSFLKNIAKQLPAGAPLCVAVPAWRDKSDNFSHLPLISRLNSLGFELIHPPLLYSRPDQVVAREILTIKTLR